MELGDGLAPAGHRGRVGKAHCPDGVARFVEEAGQEGAAVEAEAGLLELGAADVILGDPTGVALLAEDQPPGEPEIGGLDGVAALVVALGEPVVAVLVQPRLSRLR
jgi:hypothetical protein